MPLRLGEDAFELGYISDKNTKKLQKDYLEILRNSYFKKSVSYLFSNLKPKYEKIEYKIKTGDNLVNILNSLSVSKSDIQKIRNGDIK